MFLSGARRGVGRKRGICWSPYSDSWELGSVVRLSPASLAPLAASRASASGSYGHLSAGKIDFIKCCFLNSIADLQDFFLGTLSPALGLANSGLLPPLLSRGPLLAPPGLYVPGTPHPHMHPHPLIPHLHRYGFMYVINIWSINYQLYNIYVWIIY